MDIHVGSSGEIVLEKVFSGILLRSEAGEEFAICMRDSGFEFRYDGEWYEAKDCNISAMKKPVISPPLSIAGTTGSVL